MLTWIMGIKWTEKIRTEEIRSGVGPSGSNISEIIRQERMTRSCREEDK